MQAASNAGARVARKVDGERAIADLASDTLVLSDGAGWATVSIDVPSGVAMVQLVEGMLTERSGKGPTRIGYAHSVASALEQARPGRVTAALLPAVDLDRVVDVARAGGRLPEKATSFQPKPNLGAFIRLLDE
jgi:hypothetical protein